MEISKIDKNFAVENTVIKGGKRTYAIPSPLFALYGVRYDEQVKGFVRMDVDVAEKTSEGCKTLAHHTAGGRLRFATDSTSLSITVTYEDFWEMSHMPLSGACGFSLFEETDEGERYVSLLMPLHTDKKGFTATAKIPEDKKMHAYTLYFPLYNEVRSLAVTLDEGASVQKGKPYRDIAPILYYGSSITQGGCASRPDNAYQSLICKRNNIDFINLGFSGNAKAEEVMVDYLATIDCSLFVCDYDHNAPTVEYLRETHYRLYERYRKVRPTTPILFISKPDAMGDTNGKERIKIIRSTYQRAKKQGDSNVYFLSGKRFYGKQNYWDFAVDGCHPTDYGFAMMADKIYKKMIEINEIFKGR